MKTASRMLLISLCLTAVLFAAKVKSFTGKNVDISGYRTYQWLPPRVLAKTGVIENHPANSILKEAVGRELSERGLSEVSDGADPEIQSWVLTDSVPQLEAVIVAAVGIQPGTYMVAGTIARVHCISI
jgi:hypothetical protein